MQHDLVKTIPFRREAITTEFIREPADADDTVPVELYSRPYERLEVQPDSTPYERLEIERGPVVPSKPSTSFRVVAAISILGGMFALGFGLAFLVL